VWGRNKALVYWSIYAGFVFNSTYVMLRASFDIRSLSLLKTTTSMPRQETSSEVAEPASRQIGDQPYGNGVLQIQEPSKTAGDVDTVDLADSDAGW